MSQRELLIVLAHAEQCAACRQKLLAHPGDVFSGRSLTSAEKEILSRLEAASFTTPGTLARATGVASGDLTEYSDHPVTRLRHL